MGHHVGFGKLEREVLSMNSLPNDLRRSVIEFKNAVKSPNPGLRVFNNVPQVLPATAHGQCYYEFQVGQARAPTAEHPTLAGERRIVGLLDAGRNLLKIYFTDEHYRAGSWFQLQFP